MSTFIVSFLKLRKKNTILTVGRFANSVPKYVTVVQYTLKFENYHTFSSSYVNYINLVSDANIKKIFLVQVY